MVSYFLIVRGFALCEGKTTNSYDSEVP